MLVRIHQCAIVNVRPQPVAPRAYFFLSCQKKVCKKEAQDAKIALTREKTSRYILRVVVPLSVDRTPFGRPSNRVS